MPGPNRRPSTGPSPLSYIPQPMPCSPGSFSPSVPSSIARAPASHPTLRKNSPIAKFTPPVRPPHKRWASDGVNFTRFCKIAERASSPSPPPPTAENPRIDLQTRRERPRPAAPVYAAHPKSHHAAAGIAQHQRVEHQRGAQPVGRHLRQRADPRQREQLLRKGIREPDAAMAGGIARIMPRMQRDPVPGQPLHEGHRRIAVEVGAVPLPLLQDREAAGRRGLVLRPCRHAGRADQPVAAIDMDLLPREADDQIERPIRNPIVAPSERPRPERPIRDLRPHGRHMEGCATQENKQPEEKHKPFLTITPPRTRGGESALSHRSRLGTAGWGSWVRRLEIG